MSIARKPIRLNRTVLSLLGLMGTMLLISAYFIVRFGGLWSENDTGSFSVLIRNFIAAGQITPKSGPIYSNGYTYQAVSAFVVATTGVDIALLQQFIYPLTIGLIVLPAWAAYRELTDSPRGATLATALLCVQPEFLFVMLRSSHEKITRTLLLVCLFLLARSFRASQRVGSLTIYVLLFYLTAYAMIASNNLLANSFIVAVAAALGLGWLLSRWGISAWEGGRRLTKRLIYVLLVCLGLVYVFTFYAYQPARTNILVLQSIWEQLGALLLDLETSSVNPYAQVSAGWVNLPTYFLVSCANWIILLSSVIVWARQGWRWVVRKQPPASQAAWLLWLLYTAFTIQGVGSIIIDFSGALAGNLQHRLFPSFAMVAVAMVGAALSRLRLGSLPRLSRAALASVCAVVAVLSVLKATSEPLLSNKWLFYRHEEIAALRWGDKHLRYAEIWTDFDERIMAAYRTEVGRSANRNIPVGFALRPATRSLLRSSVGTWRGERVGQPLPIPYDALQIYDNGEAALHRLRPTTPYQR